MKTFKLLAIFIIALCLISTSVYSQLQRLAVLPTLKSFNITNARPCSLPSLCVDFDREPPEYNTIYNNILSGGESLISVTNNDGSVLKMTLNQAIEGDIPILNIAATGVKRTHDWDNNAPFSGTEFSINPEHPEVRSVKLNPLRSGIQVASTSGDKQNSISEIVFKTFGNQITQEDFWFKSQAIEILKANNKLEFDNSGKIKSSSLPLINNVVADLNQIEDYEAYNFIDSKTIHNLIQNRKIQIESNGRFTDNTTKYLKSLIEVKHKIEDCKLDVLHESVKNHLSLDELITKIQQENKLPVTSAPNKELNDFLEVYSEPFDIIKEFKSKGTSEKVLTHTNNRYDDKYVLRMNDKDYFFDNKSKPELLNSNIMNDLEFEHAKKVQRESDKASHDDISYIYLSSIDNSKKVLNAQIGTIEKSITLNNFDSYEEIFSQINADIENSKKNIVLSKDMFTMGKVGASEKENIGNQFGDKFIAGRHIYVDERTWINYTELIRELKTKYPDKNFYLGSDFYKDKHAITNTPKITKGSDIAAYIAPEFRGIEYQMIDDMKKKLRSGGVVVHELDQDLSSANVPVNVLQANVLLLSGHKESRYETYLRDLADKGLLKNKVVAVFSCNENGTANLNSYLIRKGLASKVIFFPSTIQITCIKAVLYELAELTTVAIPEGVAFPEGIVFDKLLDKAIDNALIKYGGLEDQLKLFKQFIKQTSFNDTSSGQENVIDKVSFPSTINLAAINAILYELTALTQNTTSTNFNELLEDAAEKALNNIDNNEVKSDIKKYLQFILQTS